MLYLISLGLNDEKDMSIKALEIARQCGILYLETYTNYNNININKLSKFLKNDIKEIQREDLENNSANIINEAAKKNVGILVGGDCLSATTHIALVKEAKENKIKVNIIHGSSIFTAVAETGLSIYNFGKTTSILLDNKNIKAPYNVLQENLKLGLHTLFLLDLKPEEKFFLSINKALQYLINQGLDKEILCIGCIALGSKKQEIKVGKVKDLLNFNSNIFPQCLIIPGKLHFMEKEILQQYKN